MKRFVRGLALVILTTSVVLSLWAFWWEPRRLVVRRDQVALPCWQGPSVRVAVASDLHVGAPHIGLTKLASVVDQINAGKPDVIVLLGDFVIQGVIGGDFESPETIAQQLARLRAPFGVFAVLGNHDWWLDAKRVQRAFEKAGIVVVEDTAVLLPFPGRPFWIAGVSDFLEGPHDVARAMAAVHDDAPVIVITHNPDVFPDIPERACLTLAGHTHGGQVAIPMIGRPIVPSQYGERYALGHVHEGGKQLFVTSGVGTSIIPVRFRVPPEVVFLEVRGRA